MGATPQYEDTLLAIPLRDKAELRLLVEKDERFANVLDKTTHDIQCIVHDGEDNEDSKILNTLARMMWKTLQILWELEDSEAGIPTLHTKQKMQVMIDELQCAQEQLHGCRRAYLRELSALRDRLRVFSDPSDVELINNVVYQEEPVMFYEPLQFVQDERIKLFVAEVVEEKLKLIMTRWCVKKDEKKARPSTAPQKSREEPQQPNPLELMLRDETARLREQVQIRDERITELMAELKAGKEELSVHTDDEWQGMLRELTDERQSLLDLNNELKTKLQSFEEERQAVRRSLLVFEHSIIEKDADKPFETINEEISEHNEEISEQVQIQATQRELSVLDDQYKELEISVIEEENVLKKAEQEQNETQKRRSQSSLGKLREKVQLVIDAKKESPKQTHTFFNRVVRAMKRIKGVEVDKSEDPDETMPETLDTTFGIARQMMQKSAADCKKMATTIEQLEEELREARESEAERDRRASFTHDDSEEIEALRMQLETMQKRVDEMQEEKNAKDAEMGTLQAQAKEQTFRIQELEGEVRRLHVVIDELTMQLMDMQQEMAKWQSLDPKKRRPVNFSHSFKRPGGSRNVFERLYRDACDRLQRLESLRQRFIQDLLKMEHLIYRVQGEAMEEVEEVLMQTDLDTELNFLGVAKVSVQNIMLRKLHSADSFRESLRSQLGAVSVHSRRAKQELDRLYPVHKASTQRRPFSATMDRQESNPFTNPRRVMTRPPSAATVARKRSLPLLLGYEGT